MLHSPLTRSGAARWHWAVVAALALWPAARALSDDTPGAQAAEPPRATISRLAASAVCRLDADCVALPVGQKACGGPESFVATVASGPHRLALDRALEQYARTRREQISRSSEVSTCVLEANPGARCQAGQCVLRARGTPAAD